MKMREACEYHEGLFFDLSALCQVAWGVFFFFFFLPYKWNIVRGGRTKHWYYFMPATACCASIWKTRQYVWTTRCILRVAHHSVPFQLCTRGNQGAGSLEWLLWATSPRNDLWKLISSTCFPKKVCPCTLEDFFLPLSQALFPAFI